VNSNASRALAGLVVLLSSAAAQQSSIPSSKLLGTAIVVLTHDFCTAEVKRGDEVFRPGRSICPAAEEAVRNSFESVIRMETAPKPGDAGGRLVLIPRYADMEATTTATTVGKRKIALLLEWSAFDPSGKILWVQTVEGDAGKAAGFNHQKLVEMVTRDLVAKSTDAIEKSQEIRQFVENVPSK
jgi:hypothetical protein